MNKKTLFLILLGVLVLPSVVLALGAYGSSINICQIITGIENFVWIIFGGIATICFIVAGILFLTAGGDAQKITTAKSAFIWGLAGVVVGIIAFSILAIIGVGIGVGSVGTGC